MDWSDAPSDGVIARNARTIKMPRKIPHKLFAGRGTRI